MLVLKDITKNYYVGNDSISVLKEINLEFNDVGFTSILGPSGSGKTTLLNIIGGLDKYTSGDLIIDHKSTKMFKDNDWDAYRNAKIGFVFQSYHLISHLSVLDNVSMALSLSGISSKERIKRAKEALNKVGLSNHLNKKPNQLSGGQMQRVAIARAFINNPSIILADEPTGALDSITSIQVMDILKEISKEHLVIMVTHNEEIAKQYSDRIIEVKDGTIINDTKPITEKVSNKQEKLKNRSTKMSFISALSSSFKNLLSKKSRTILTVFAGSIGIIGVALVLSISNGMNNFISDMEKDTLAGFPLTISQNVQTNLTMPTDLSVDSGSFPTDHIFHSYDISGNTVLHKNVITKEYIDYIENMNKEYYSAIHYNYSIGKNLISKLDDGTYKLVDTTISSTDMFHTTSVFSEMPNNKDFILSQYDILAGTYPSNYKEVVLVVDKDNQIDTMLLEAFGMKEKENYTSDEWIGKSFKLIMNDDYYTKYGNVFIPSSDYESLYESENSIEITICGIMRIKEEGSGELLATGINYTTDLTDQLFQENQNSKIVNAQKEDMSINVLTGALFDEQMGYDDVMQSIGGSKIPYSIQIYPKNFEDKDEIKEYLENYNSNKETNEKIVYTDLSETMSSSLSSMTDTVSIILVAFAGISLVVSTVMIGIITYVSVVERTKEIGIMRAIGARKKDISRIFNAETMIIGFSSGILGILLNRILCIPASTMISNMVGIHFNVSLQLYYCFALIILSMLLTLIAGFFPSKIAARKDPVTALRTE